ncbi:hypothetical protein EYF80_048285 [Liparis tanakae]|uniref:Uncharacterized protein n=1 Tax=Liparis tanakae TaxID=230148 RepID=A0A4Z2FL86_9TELE|nr:hypothetical protein EYF80_048285 [Liparis tanakae]
MLHVAKSPSGKNGVLMDLLVLTLTVPSQSNQDLVPYAQHIEHVMGAAALRGFPETILQKQGCSCDLLSGPLAKRMNHIPHDKDSLYIHPINKTGQLSFSISLYVTLR